MAERFRSIGNYIASRTKWFDQFLLAAGELGATQVVILAAGLDARGWRLPWPDGTVVYEIDQPRVLGFKAEVLRDDPPVAKNVPVPVDLRSDWPSSLEAKGFDASQPTAWTAEGLLAYLTAGEQDLLFERIGGLSAPGSRIAVESFGAGFFDPEHLASRREQLRRLREASGEEDSSASDIEDLWHVDQRRHLTDWLTARGWSVTSVDAEELMRRYGRPPMEEAANPRTIFVEGKRVAG
jgi:methyltransferase (TIGR00027 family)